MIAIDTDSVRELLEDTRDDVLSLYVNVDPAGTRASGRGKEAWRGWLGEQLARLERDLPVDKRSRSRWEEAVNRLEGFLSGYEPAGKTLVSFVTPAGHRFAELPVALEQASGYGRPMLHRLLWAIEDHRHYLIVLVTDDGLRLVSGYLAHREGRARLELDEQWDTPWAARSARQEGTGHVYRKALARELGGLVLATGGVDGILLGGDADQAHELRSLLHPAAAAVVAGILPIPVDLGDEDVLEQAERVAVPYERERDRELVERLARLASQGRAVGDPDEVLHALDRHRVRTLILSAPFPDLELSEELLRKAFVSSSTVDLVRGTAAETLRAQGGVGAELYWGL